MEEVEGLVAYGVVTGLALALLTRGRFESGPDHEEVNMPMGAYVRVERPAIVPLACAA